MSRFSLAAMLCSLVYVPSAMGQGLIFNLPAEGNWIRYEGQVTQKDARPERPEGIEELTWSRHITLRALGSAQGEFRGQTQNCRWIEIEVVTGQPTEGGIDGPRKIYKVLVPESIIDGKARDSRGVPVAMLPIVKGYKKLGFGEVKPIRAKALQVYPGISLLAHYSDPQVEAPNGIPKGGGNINANSGTQYAGTVTIERNTTKAVNSAKFWVSPQAPFGLVNWTVNMKRFTKDLTDKRADFKMVSEVDVEMTAQEVNQNAEAVIQEQ